MTKTELAERGLLEMVLGICKRHGVLIEEVWSRDRCAPVCNARAAIAAQLYVELEWSYPKIGKLLDRNHDSVLRMLSTRGFPRRPTKVEQAPHVEPSGFPQLIHAESLENSPSLGRRAMPELASCGVENSSVGVAVEKKSEVA